MALMDALTNLSQNKLLMQYLAGAGADISAGQPLGTNVNAVTSQAITAQNFSKLLAEILRGGGNMKADKDRVKLDIPTGLTDLQIPQAGQTGTSAAAPTLQQPKLNLNTGFGIGSNFLNPSPSPLDISAADLAGLTPEMISQALQLKLGFEQLGQKKMTDMMDMIYRGAQISKLGAGSPLDQPHPLLPGLTVRQLNALPNDEKSYQLYLASAKAIGDDDPLTKREWELTDPTEKERYLRALQNDPSLMKTVAEVARQTHVETPPKRPLVTWTTASSKLSDRFGKMDSTGRFAFTDDLMATHTKAQEYLVELKNQGYEPLDAVNKAESMARSWLRSTEDKYFMLLEKAVTDDQINKVKRSYLNRFGYLPTKKEF